MRWVDGDDLDARLARAERDAPGEIADKRDGYPKGELPGASLNRSLLTRVLGEGTGLGLGTSYRICGTSGDIRVFSRRTLIFQVRLPIQSRVK